MRLVAFVPCIRANTWGTLRGKGGLELRRSEANGQDSYPTSPHGRDGLFDRPGIDPPYGLHAVLQLHFAQEEELYQSVSEPYVAKTQLTRQERKPR